MILLPSTRVDNAVAVDADVGAVIVAFVDATVWMMLFR